MGKLNTFSWVGISELDDNARRVSGEAHCWTPDADVLETSKGFVIEVELPGMGLDDVKVELRGSELLVFGNRACRYHVDTVAHHVMERACGTFARTFVLPRRIDAEDVSATFNHGLLVLTIKKVGSANRSIPVE